MLHVPLLGGVSPGLVDILGLGLWCLLGDIRGGGIGGGRRGEGGCVTGAGGLRGGGWGKTWGTCLGRHQPPSYKPPFQGQERGLLGGACILDREVRGQLAIAVPIDQLILGEGAL